jgi:excisionase family DNA binding protein
MENGIHRFEKKYLSVDDLSAYLSCSISKIYKMVESGQIPFAHIPGTKLIRFPKKEIDEWMDKHIVKPVV